MTRRLGGLSNLSVVGLVVLLVAGWLIAGQLTAATATIVVSALYFAIPASSFNFLYGSLGIFSLMQPVFAAAGGYTTAYLFNAHHVSPWISLVIAPIVAAIIAVPVAFAAVRAGTGPVLTALVTLIISEAVPAILVGVKPLGGAVGLYVDVPPTPSFSDLQFVSPTTYVRIFLVLNVLVLAFLIWWRNSRYGLYVTAVKDSPDAAEAVGIPTARIRIVTIVISGMMASFGGVIYAQYNLLSTPDLFLGEAALFQVIVIALVAGVDRPWGTLVAAMLIVYISNKATDWADGRQGVGPLVFAAIFVLVALVMPRGITGTWAQIRANRSGRPSAGARREHTEEPLAMSSNLSGTGSSEA